MKLHNIFIVIGSAAAAPTIAPIKLPAVINPTGSNPHNVYNQGHYNQDTDERISAMPINLPVNLMDPAYSQGPATDERISAMPINLPVNLMDPAYSQGPATDGRIPAKPIDAILNAYNQDKATDERTSAVAPAKDQDGKFLQSNGRGFITNVLGSLATGIFGPVISAIVGPPEAPSAPSAPPAPNNGGYPPYPGMPPMGPYPPVGSYSPYPGVPPMGPNMPPNGAMPPNMPPNGAMPTNGSPSNGGVRFYPAPLPFIPTEGSTKPVESVGPVDIKGPAQVKV